jgi:hypothetical protein
MSEPSIPDRIVFQKDEQSRFVLECKNKLGMTWEELSKLLKVSSRSIKDWSYEDKKMSYNAAKILSKKSGIPIPKNIQVIKWIDHLKEAGKLGGHAHYQKYGKVGDEEKRKEAWFKWWNDKGKFQERNNRVVQRKPVYLEQKSVKLAEFVGIMIGDGHISKYQIKVSLDSLMDVEYIVYVFTLIKILFKVTPSLYRDKKKRVTNIVVSRKDLVEFCESIGLKVGDKLKLGIDIPDWIKNDTKFSIACVRGLVDTDGCIFNHSYKVNNKMYKYIKIAFTSKSPEIRKSVSDILIKHGIHVRITKDENDIRIESKEGVKKYLKVFRTNNIKFLERIK